MCAYIRANTVCDEYRSFLFFPSLPSFSVLSPFGTEGIFPVRSTSQSISSPDFSIVAIVETKMKRGSRRSLQLDEMREESNVDLFLFFF